VIILRDLRRAAAARLTAAGIETPDLDARLLIGHALGLERHHFLTQAERPVTADEADRAHALIERRAAREPVSRILGRREFWSLDFDLGSATLDPRPDTETAVEAVLKAVGDRSAPLSLLDLGAGTGCILLALLSELPNATGTGLDISPQAVAVATANAARLGLGGRARFVAGDWNQGLANLFPDRRFDVIVSNPPYIPQADVASLEPEVARFDPPAALVGGADGLEAYRALSPQVKLRLNKGGLVVFEVGIGQAGDVEALLTAAGLTPGGTAADLAGIDRCVIARTEG